MNPMSQSLSAVDAALREIVAADGVHLVHVWAPWCDNSLHEHGARVVRPRRASAPTR